MNWQLLMSMNDVFDESTNKNPSMQNILSEKGGNAFHFVNLPGLGAGNSLSFLGHAVKYFDIFAALMLFIGIAYMIYSNIGSNGETQWRGAHMLIGMYLFVIFLHIVVTLFVSYSNLAGGKIMGFFALLAGQLVVFSGTILSFALGFVYQHVHLILNDNRYDIKSKKAFSMVNWALFGGLFISIFLGFV